MIPKQWRNEEGGSRKYFILNDHIKVTRCSKISIFFFSQSVPLKTNPEAPTEPWPGRRGGPGQCSQASVPSCSPFLCTGPLLVCPCCLDIYPHWQPALCARPAHSTPLILHEPKHKTIGCYLKHLTGILLIYMYYFSSKLAGVCKSDLYTQEETETQRRDIICTKSPSQEATGVEMQSHFGSQMTFLIPMTGYSCYCCLILQTRFCVQ